MPGREVILTRTVLARLSALGLPEPPQRLSTSSFLLTLALLQQSNAIAPIAAAVVEAFTRAPDAPYIRLPVDLGIVVEPYGLITRAGRALPPAAQRLARMMTDPEPASAQPSGATVPPVII
jgi:DNA-binding transcriptional LysR family regulator